MSASLRQPRLRHARVVGERVELRPLRAADADEAFPLIHAQEEVLRWLVWEGPRDLDELRSSYAEFCRPSDEGDDYRFAIVDRERGEFAGSIGPRFQGHPGLGDLGYWLAQRAWGRGLASEALRLLTHLCFRELEAQVLYGYVFVGNEASRRVLEKVGYEHEYTARGKTLKRGQPIDEWYLALSRNAWARQPDWEPLEIEVEFEPDAR